MMNDREGKGTENGNGGDRSGKEEEEEKKLKKTTKQKSHDLA